MMDIELYRRERKLSRKKLSRRTVVVLNARWQGPEECAPVGGSPDVNSVCSGNDIDGEHLWSSIPALASRAVKP
ncbi:hypothetical protein [Sinorhizobium sp. M4_45]|uniref:hypothetical protein n=1 Tax=Sinorhizobium sp. M4_45 TaxID=2037901 RepID=UPI0011AF8CB8|nr:hypothetical protein [Sinorhizobium sp. M4_45]